MNVSIEFVIWVIGVGAVGLAALALLRTRRTMNVLAKVREETAELHAAQLGLERRMRLSLASSVRGVSEVIEEYLETLRNQKSPKPEEATSVLVTVAEGLEGIAKEACDSEESTRITPRVRAEERQTAAGAG